MALLANSTESLKNISDRFGSLSDSERDLKEAEKVLIKLMETLEDKIETNGTKISDVLRDVYAAKNKMHTLKSILNALASTTISRIKRLKNLLAEFVKDKEYKEKKVVLKVLVKSMKQLLERSQGHLADALAKYSELQGRIINIKVGIAGLQTGRVDIVYDEMVSGLDVIEFYEEDYELTIKPFDKALDDLSRSCENYIAHS